MSHCQVCDRKRDCALAFSMTDKYCGVCGVEIRKIHSPQQAPRPKSAEKVAWIYPESDEAGQKEYRLKVTMEYGNAAGQIVRDCPVPADESESVWASASGQVPLERVDRKNPTVCVLPAPRKLPREGLYGTVRLVGAFGVEEVPVLVCRTPDLDLDIPSRDRASGFVRSCKYVKRNDVRTYEIHVWKKAKIEVLVQVVAKTGPVLCRDLARLVKPDPGIQLVPHEWRLLEPGIPKEFRFSINFSDFKTGEHRDALIELPLHGVTFGGEPALAQLRFSFCWDDIGDLKFTPRNLHVRELQWGQSRSVNIAVENIGTANIGRMTVQSNEPWIRIATESAYFQEISGAGAGAKSRQTIGVVIDSDKMDRDHRGSMEGKITVKEDSAKGRKWEIPVTIDVMVDPEPLNAVLALDFGSANSCVAYSTLGDEDARSLPLNLLRKEEQLEIPSAIYFHSVKPRDNPDISIGNEAIFAADLPVGTVVPDNPDPEKLNGLVEDAKRWIGTNRKFTVFDIHGRRESYFAEEIIGFSLRMLIDRARQTREIRRIELSFPTKFTRDQRDAYHEVLKKLQRHYDHFSVVQLAHKDQLRLDEASAATVAFMYHEARNINDKFVLVTIDWGGGTLDHCIMEVQPIEGDRAGRFRTTYRGLGGDAHLGGNDVSCALVPLVREQLTEQLVSMFKEAGAGEVELDSVGIPFCWPRSSDEDSTQVGLKNFHLLWTIAERLKVFLSSREEDPSFLQEKTLPQELLKLLLGEIDVEIYDQQEKGITAQKISSIERDLPGLMDRFVQAVLSITLKAAYKIPLTHQTRPDSLVERLTNCLLQIQRQLEVAGIEDFEVLLAGAGSRLPLLTTCIEQILGKDVRIHRNSELAKRRVANGLAIYGKVSDVTGSFFKGFARPSQVLCDSLGILTVVGVAEAKFLPIIHAGTFWKPENDEVFEFDFSEQSWQSRAIRGGTVFRAYPLFAGSTLNVVGVFDLDSIKLPNDLDPDDLPSDSVGRLRILGPGEIQLQVEISGTTYGWFEFKWDVNDVWN